MGGGVLLGPLLQPIINPLLARSLKLVHEWRSGQWISMLESLDPEEQLLWKKARRMMRKPTPSTPMVTLEGLALSNSEKAEALADSMDTQFQSVNRTVGTGNH